jgi:hypothetical protein
MNKKRELYTYISGLRVGWDGTKKLVPWDKIFRVVPWDGTVLKTFIPPWDRTLLKNFSSHGMGWFCKFFVPSHTIPSHAEPWYILFECSNTYLPVCFFLLYSMLYDLGLIFVLNICSYFIEMKSSLHSASQPI